jgi:hypothetical protein
MADPIRRLQSGNVPLAGVSSLPTPNMNFGQQRPEIAMQAQAESASTLSRVLSGLSTSMFGQAERLAEAAGDQFVMENPPDLAQLEAMSKGDPGTFKKNFTLNAYQASIQKFRAIELAAHAESEVTKAAGIMQRRIETGRYEDGTTPYEVSTKKVAEEFQSMIGGWSSSLAAVSPDARYKYRATAATHANRVLQAAAKKETEIALAKNKLKIASDVGGFAQTTANILQNALPIPGLSINQEIEAEKARIVGNAITLGGADAGNFALEQLGTIERDIKTAYLENAVVNRMEGIGGDLASLNARIQSRSLPPDLQRVWDSMSIVDQKKARDKMDAQYQVLIDQKKKDQEVNKRVRSQEVAGLISEYLTLPEDIVNKPRLNQIIDDLKSRAIQNPDELDIKFVLSDLPDKRYKKETDDYESLATFVKELREGVYKDEVEAYKASLGRGISGKTALSEIQKYLGKDHKQEDYDERVFEIKDLLRTKAEDPLTKRVINTKEALKLSLAARRLTFADAPSNADEQLRNPPDVADNLTDYAAVQDYYDLAKNSSDLIAFAKTKKLGTKTIEKLAGEYRQYLATKENQVRASTNRIVDVYGTKSPTKKAEYALDKSAEIENTYQALIRKWNDEGKVDQKPTIADAEEIVTGKTLKERRVQKYNSIELNLKQTFGAGGSAYGADAPKNIDLAKVQAGFNKDGTISTNYLRRLEDELRRNGIKPDSRQGRQILDGFIPLRQQMERTARGE